LIDDRVWGNQEVTIIYVFWVAEYRKMVEKLYKPVA